MSVSGDASGSASASTCNRNDPMIMVAFFSDVTKQLPLKIELAALIISLKPLVEEHVYKDVASKRFVCAFSSATPMFLTNYKLNFPL